MKILQHFIDQLFTREHHPEELPRPGLLFVDTLCERKKDAGTRWVIMFLNGTISFNHVMKTTLFSFV